MAAPLIEAGDCTESGNNSASSSWSITRPAQSTGDLIICCLVSDADVTHGTLPGGPNGETAVTITSSFGGTSQRISVWYWVATGANGSGSVTVTPSASEQWTACVVRVPAGEFDATTPIGASQTSNDTTADTVAQTPAFTAGATDWGGTLCAWIGMDTVQVTSAASGWTIRASEDRGAMGGTFLTRDAYTQGGESIAAADHTISSETDSTVAFIVRGPGPIINAVPAAASSTAPSPASRVDAFVQAVAGTASAVVSVVSATITATAYAVAAAAASAAPAPTASGDTGGGAEVAAVVAAATASIPADSPTITTTAYAAAGAATASAPAPAVSTASGSEVQAVTGTATGEAPAPAVSAGSAVEVVAAAASSSAPAPSSAVGVTVAAPASTAQAQAMEDVPVAWSAHGSFSFAADGTVTRTATSGLSGVATGPARSGSCWVQATATAADKLAVIGLSYDDPADDFQNIDYYVLLGQDGIARHYENGSFIASLGSYTVGDVFRVEYGLGPTGSAWPPSVQFFKNGTEVRRSLVDPSFPLIPCAWVHIQSATLGPCRQGAKPAVSVGATVSGTAATASATTPAPSAAAGSEVAAQTAQAGAEAPPPTATGTGTSEVAAVPATAGAAAGPAEAGGSASIGGAIANATASTPAPVIQSSATVQSVPARAAAGSSECAASLTLGVITLDATYKRWGQSFTAAEGDLLSVRFVLRRYGADPPSGSVTAKLYAHTGVFGQSSVPTGSPLATSDAIQISTIPASYVPTDFVFSTPYTLSAGTPYVLTIESPDVYALNWLAVWRSASSTDLPGSRSYYISSWQSSTGEDLSFYLQTSNDAAPPSVSAGSEVAGVAGGATADASAPTADTGSTVAAVVATASPTVPAPVASGAGTSEVLAVSATASGAVPADGSTITATAYAPASAATASVPAPVVVQGVSGTAATADASVPAPVVTGAGVSGVAAVPATANAAVGLDAPTVAVTVYAVKGTAAAAAPVPDVQHDGVVAATPASASSTVPITGSGAISGEQGVDGAGTATAATNTPSISATGAPSTVNAVSAAALATAPVPAVNTGQTIVVVRAQTSASIPAVAVGGGANGAVASATAGAQAPNVVGGDSGLVIGVAAVASAEAATPGISFGTVGVAAQATAAVPLPIVATIVTAVPAQAGAEANVVGVSISALAARAAALASAPPPSYFVSVGSVDVNTTSVTAQATADTATPLVVGDTAGAVAAAAGAECPTPEVAYGSNVSAVVAQTVGSVLVPGMSGNRNITCPRGGALADVPAPVVTGNFVSLVAAVEAQAQAVVVPPQLVANSTLSAVAATAGADAWGGTGGTNYPEVSFLFAG